MTEPLERLVAVAAAVKVTQDAHRQTVLVRELQRVGERLVSDFRLPLSPAMLVRGLDIEVRSNEWGGKGKRERSGFERARLYMYVHVYTTKISKPLGLL